MGVVTLGLNALSGVGKGIAKQLGGLNPVGLLLHKHIEHFPKDKSLQK